MIPATDEGFQEHRLSARTPLAPRIYETQLLSTPYLNITESILSLFRLSWPIERELNRIFDKDVREIAVETPYPSFMKFTEYYFETYYLFFRLFLTPPPFPREQDRSMPLQPNIPRHLHAAYNLLHLPPEASLADARIQYRKLAKRSHPDAGGKHADFLLLQQAYEQVVTYLQANARARN